MNSQNKPPVHQQYNPHGLVQLFKNLTGKIASLFKPEEVEIEFKGEGNKMRYTYKVTHK